MVIFFFYGNLVGYRAIVTGDHCGRNRTTVTARKFMHVCEGLNLNENAYGNTANARLKVSYIVVRARLNRILSRCNLNESNVNGN